MHAEDAAVPGPLKNITTFDPPKHLGPDLQHYEKAEAWALAEPETGTYSMSENDLQMDF